MAISCLILLQDSRDFGIPPKNDLITATSGYGLKDDEICAGNFHKSTRLMKITDLEFASWITKAQDEIMNFTEYYGGHLPSARKRLAIPFSQI